MHVVSNLHASCPVRSAVDARQRQIKAHRRKQVSAEVAGQDVLVALSPERRCGTQWRQARQRDVRRRN